MKLPKHKCSLTISHNSHKDCYDEILDYVDDNNFDWYNEEHKIRCIATNEIWEMHWYPETPIGFICVVAPTLEELLQIVNEE
jgi:hypothetical protein